MWLLPLEKLPPLALGPLLILAGVFVSLAPGGMDIAKQLEYLAWGVVVVFAGIVVSAYGLWKRQNDKK